MKTIGCPGCGKKMLIKRLECPDCDISVDGTFYSHRFGYLDQEQLDFIESFILTRGNMREMEEVLGVSYPTVKSRLDKIIKHLNEIKANEKTQMTKKN